MKENKKLKFPRFCYMGDKDTDRGMLAIYYVNEPDMYKESDIQFIVYTEEELAEKIKEYKLKSVWCLPLEEEEAEARRIHEKYGLELLF